MKSSVDAEHAENSETMHSNTNLDTSRFSKSMQTYILLNAYKNLVNENAAGRNIARYFSQRNLEISDATYVSEMQHQIGMLINKIGNHGQNRLMYVCNLITQQNTNNFAKHNVWATCAITGRSCNEVIALSIEHSITNTSQNHAIFQCLSPLRCKSNDTVSISGCIYVDSIFETFVHSLWVVTHIRQIESIRVVTLAEDHIKNWANSEIDSKITQNLANFYDWLLDNNIFVHDPIIEQYIKSFEIVIAILNTTIDEIDARYLHNAETRL